MRVLLFGATGKLGSRLVGQILEAGWDLTCANTHRKVNSFQKNPGLILDLIDQHKPDVVINATAMNGIEACAEEPIEALFVNAITPSLMAYATAKYKIPLIHFSTDYIFAGRSGGKYIELDIPFVDSHYGMSKHLGEFQVPFIHTGSFTFRVSTLYDSKLTGPLDPVAQALAGAGTKANPLKLMDQTCCPTSVDAIAKAICHVIERGLPCPGIYHLTTTQPVSRQQFTWRILERIFGNREWNFEIYQPKLPRPRTSVLDCTKFQETFNITLPSWEEDLEGWLFKQPEFTKLCIAAS